MARIPASIPSLLACAAMVCAQVLMLLTSCERRDDVRTYDAPKETPIVTAKPPTLVPPAAPSQPVKWTVPEGWKEAASSQSVRAATYEANGVEVSVTSFPGDVGGLLANVNRWRGQMGLSAIDEGGLAQSVRTSQSMMSRVSLVSLDGADGNRMLGAIIDVGDSNTWFVKATGAGEQLESLRADFESMALSFRVDQGVTGWTPGAGESRVTQRLAAWNPPTNWTSEPDASGIAAAAFRTRSGTEGARITLTSLKSDGGGELSNINRWRDQLGLPMLTNMSEQPMVPLDDSRGSGTRVVDITSRTDDDRMICVMVNEGPATWFFKVRGTSAGVEGVREPFLSFVRAVGLGE
jgi:stage V sporulation protein SpoVS